MSPHHQINLPMPKFFPLVHPFRALFYTFSSSIVQSNFSHFAHGLFCPFLFLQQVFVANSKEQVSINIIVQGFDANPDGKRPSFLL